MRGLSAIPESGELIAGKYYLQHELGRGGMGAVFAAVHHTTGRRFAIKLLNPQLAGDEDAETRFFREAMLASAINHPAIIEVYDAGRHAGAPYMAMKLLDGESLGARIARGALPADEAVAIMLPVLDGVAAAHARGILHRDLKPDNILLSREDGGVRPKILDFGICKLLGPDAEPRLTRTGISIGTPSYMSPEQVRGEAGVDARADVYSLGVILYEMLTGTLPYAGNNFADLVVKIVAGDAPRARACNPSVHVALDSVIARAMARDAAQRYPSATALADDLRRYRALKPVARVRTPSAVASSAPRAAAVFASAQAQRVSSLPPAHAATSAPRGDSARASTRWPWLLAFACAALALAVAALWPPRVARPRQRAHAPAAVHAVRAAAARRVAIGERPTPALAAAPVPAPDVAAGTPGAAEPPTVTPIASPRAAPARSAAARAHKRNREPAGLAHPPAMQPDEPPPPAPKRRNVPNEILDPFADPE